MQTKASPQPQAARTPARTALHDQHQRLLGSAAPPLVSQVVQLPGQPLNTAFIEWVSMTIR